MDTGKVLVNYDNFGKPQLQVDGLNVIRKIPNDFEIYVLTALGPGRIGKSSLLNQLIGKDSFGVGSTTSRVTKGIWIDSILDHSKKIATLYLDVEGFGDPNRDDAGASDIRLMFIVCQICDVVMYNTKGVYDSDMVGKLEFVCNMFQRYRKHNKVFSKPILIVCFRDFDLDVPEDPIANLKDLLGTESNDCFRSMEAFVFAKPTTRPNLRHIQTMSDADLDQRYINNRKELELFLKKEARPLCTCKGDQITSSVLVEAIQKTVKAVNDDNLEGITNTLIDLLQQQNVKKVDDSVAKYERQVNDNWPIATPAEYHHDRLQNSMKVELKDKLYDIEGDVDLLLGKFEMRTNQIFHSVSEQKANEQLKKLSSVIEQGYENRAYFKIDGSAQFLTEMESLEKKYKGCRNLGPQAHIVWEKYNQSQTRKKQTIRDEENNLMQKQEAERRREEARKEKERMEFEKERLKKGRLDMERMQEMLQYERDRQAAEHASNIAKGIIEFGVRIGVRWLLSKRDGN